MSASDELANFKLQLEQVEAALLKDSNNEELLKLKGDLQEVIALQKEIVAAEQTERKAEADPSSSGREWRMGERVLAKGTNGQYYAAIIDGISGSTASVTFLGNKQQVLVELTSLRPAPHQEKSVFDNRRGGQAPAGANQKEWQAERERKRLKSLKKDMKRKELDQAKETEKSSWHKFNTKASSKGMKGVKKVVGSAAAADGPSGVRSKDISSRMDPYLFKQTSRGNMDSLF
ncbi:unnamed protein product, partial [Mesorhabditis belari]|uniref:Tudor domain-containing protein n=1 Tax=Mesorhabditis belari TaxID=2138241 RepID=A0AAF3F0W4_9BILA